MESDMLKENITIFNDKLQPYLEVLEQTGTNKELNDYILIDSKADVPTIQVERDGRKLFIHSKYNPLNEAKKIATDLENEISDKGYIIFFGVGLGYHIEEVMTKYPQKKYVIIEPEPELFYRFLQSRTLQQFPVANLSGLYLPSERISLEQFITTLVSQVKGDAHICVLPSYERLFQEKVTVFYETYQQALKSTRSSVVTTRAFSKRWIINSIMNAPTTLTTQNILEKKAYFQGKPIIIASAGPSLKEDMEQLKYIKENGLAYIFAVGSANKAFISEGIKPDAVLTYDPQPHNVNVFKEFIASGETDIPMIYGTSVGFETIETYPGPKFHFINSADTATNYLMNRENTFDVHDSTTIALIAIQVAEKLEAGKIILAGQNLAFKDNRYYSPGIKHGDWEGNVRAEKEGKDVTTTKDVYGNTIETNESLNNMRRDIEMYIEKRPHLSIVNTTKGGADIKGAPFKPIEQVIKEQLIEKVVDDDWKKTATISLPAQQLQQVIQKIERSIDRMYMTLEECQSLLQRLSNVDRTSKVKQRNNLLKNFSKQFQRLLNNDFYQHVVYPIVKMEFEQLNKLVRDSYTETDQLKKIELLIAPYANFLMVVQEVFSEIRVHVQDVIYSKLVWNIREERKIYMHNDGVFEYNGQWERESVTFNDLSSGKNKRKINKTISTMTNKQGANIRFQFQGTTLALYAQTHSNFSNHIKITIDGTEKRISTKDRNVKDFFPPKINEKVFEVTALENKMHDVVIELMNDEPFHFQGVAINSDGRIYHVDEVTSIEDLEVGKRIRCHYKATTNKVGKFSQLGTANHSFIPVSSTPQPDGDFYFIMVDEENGEKKLIADRNVQNYISWDTLYEAGVATEEGIKLIEADEIKMNIRLMTGGTFKGDTDNEWDKYLSNSLNKKIKEDDEFIWNCGSIKTNRRLASWTLSKVADDKDKRMRRTFEGPNRYAISQQSQKNQSSINSGFRPLLVV